MPTQTNNLQLKRGSVLTDTPLNFTQCARWTGVGAQQLLLRDSPAVKLHRQPDVRAVLAVSQILV